MNAAPEGSAGFTGPDAMPRLRPADRGEAAQVDSLSARAKLSPKLHPPPSGSRGASPRYSVFIWKLNKAPTGARQPKGVRPVGLPPVVK